MTTGASTVHGWLIFPKQSTKREGLGWFLTPVVAKKVLAVPSKSYMEVQSDVCN